MCILDCSNSGGGTEPEPHGMGKETCTEETDENNDEPTDSEKITNLCFLLTSQ